MTVLSHQPHEIGLAVLIPSGQAWSPQATQPGPHGWSRANPCWNMVLLSPAPSALCSTLEK